MELTALLEKLKMDHLDAQLETICEQAAERDLGSRRAIIRDKSGGLYQK